MRIGQKGYLRSGIALGVLAIALGGSVPALAQVTLNGPPIQVTPNATEPGVPMVTITPGSINPLGGDTDPNGGGTTTGTGTSSGSGSADSDALNTLLGQSWGAQAVSEAEAVGVNPSALAATCVIESGCQNVSGSGAQGAFQMYSAAYQEGLQTALAANPTLASQIVQGSAGMNDPATEAIAASGYLMQANSALQSAGVTSPTVLDARAYYNFGPMSGTQLATALPTETVAGAMPNVSAATLASNGVTPGETVAQWQAAESSKIGNAASASILG
jgi:hypothetical protein